MIVNNNGTVTDAYRITLIKNTTASVSSALSDNSLGLSTTGFSNLYSQPDQLKGLYINPNLNQNTTLGMADDSMFEIAANTMTTLTSLGNSMTAVGAPGNTFRLVLNLDNLEVRGKGNLNFGSQDIIYRSGDLSSNDATTFVSDGTITAGRVEDANVTAKTLNAQGGSLTWGNISVPNGTSLILTNGTFNVGNISLAGNATLTTSNGTFTLANVSSTGSGAINITGTAVTIGDLTSSGTGAINLTGPFTINNISLTNGAALSFTNGTSTVNSFAASSSNVTLTNSTITLPGLTAGNLTLNTNSNLVCGATDLSANIVVAGDINLNTGSNIKSKNTTSTVEYRLYMTGTNITVDGTSKINADFTGYPQVTGGYFRSQGNRNMPNYNNQSTNGGGGSYGGHGGSCPSCCCSGQGWPNDVYGNMKEPNDLGSSSGGTWSSQGNGGGAIRLVASDTVTNNGVITANGTGSVGEAGSGGSVWITTGKMKGTGVISANGGSSNDRGAGGGGRISIITTIDDFIYGSYVLSNMHNAVTAYGGPHTGNNIVGAGAAGTIYLRSATRTYPTIIINNNGTVTDANHTTTIKNSTISTSSSLAANNIGATGGFQNLYNQADQLKGLYINPNTNQGGTSSLADDNVYEIVSNTTSAATTAAGDGDMTAVAAAGNTFKVSLVAENLEVRGKARLNFGTHDIIVKSGDLASNNSTTFNSDGSITAGKMDWGNVNTATINAQGGNFTLGATTIGSGQGLSLTNGNFTMGDMVLSGTGTLTTSSGNTTMGNLSSTGSGAISIAGTTLVTGNISTTSSAPITINGTTITTGNLTSSGTGALSLTGSYTMGDISLTNGAAFSLINGTSTINSFSAPSSSVTITNTTVTLPGITAANLTLNTNTNMICGATDLNPNIVATGNININSGSSIKSKNTTATTEYRLYLTAANISLESTGKINADATGYPQVTGGYFRSQGNRNMPNYNNQPTNGGGGSYGGHGGSCPSCCCSGQGWPNEVYGNMREPNDLGSSSGGTWQSQGNGGGAIRLVVSDTVTNNGLITANGTGSVSEAGSGGSIWITTGKMKGTGLLSANGGSSNDRGSGGGGRISVITTVDDFIYDSYVLGSIYNAITAYGGLHTGNNTVGTGAAGTIFLKSATRTYPTVIINNNNNTTDANHTTLIKTTSGTVSSSLTATTLGASNAFSNLYSQDNQLKGLYLKPSTLQSYPATLFEILSNTSGQVTTPGDMTTVGALSGDTYKIVLNVDNLEVRGKARLNYSGQDIYVRNGDVSSNNTTTFRLDGGITAGTVDVTQTTTWTTTGNAVESITKKCAVNFQSCP